MSPLLKIENLQKSFRKSNELFTFFLNSVDKENNSFNAVNDVTLTIFKNEMLGLIGESGSGKTTLIRTIMKLTEASNGKISFKSEESFKPLSDIPKYVLRSKMRMIFQHPDAVLNPAYTIEMILDQAIKITEKEKLFNNSIREGSNLYEKFQQLISYKIKLCKQNTKSERLVKIKNILNEVGLSENYLKKYPHELSGGEKRRVSICRALLSDPTVIFADEPISGLDVALQHQILNLLEEEKKKRELTIVFITHDIGVVQKKCDRIAVMFAGKLLELGTNRDVSPNNCLHPYTKILYDAQMTLENVNKNSKGDLLSNLFSEDSSDNNIITGCSYRMHCPVWLKNGKSELCIKEQPELEIKNGAPDHFVACHFA